MWNALEVLLASERGAVVVVFAAMGAGVGLRVVVGRSTDWLRGRRAARQRRA